MKEILRRGRRISFTTEAWAGHDSCTASAGLPVDLSPREQDVLAALVEHRSNAEIAARFVLSVRTVESHVAARLRTTGAANRRELAELGVRTVALGDGRARTPEPPSSFMGREAEQGRCSGRCGRIAS